MYGFYASASQITQIVIVETAFVSIETSEMKTLRPISLSHVEEPTFLPDLPVAALPQRGAPK